MKPGCTWPNIPALSTTGQIDIPQQPRHNRRRERRQRERRSTAGSNAFWRALHSDQRRAERRSSNATSQTGADNLLFGDVRDLSTGTPVLSQKDWDARRVSLKSMLNTSKVRYDKAIRNRRPVLRSGVRVRVISGPMVGEHGSILDADYIKSRVLLSLPQQHLPVWVEFAQVGAPNET